MKIISQWPIPGCLGFTHMPYQVADHGHIRQQDQNLTDRRPEDYLPGLERYQRGRDDGRQPLSPALFHPQADALDRENRRIHQGDDAKQVNARQTEAAEPLEQLSDDAVLQSIGPRLRPGEQLRCKRRIAQAQFTISDQKQQHHFHQLVERDGASTRKRFLGACSTGTVM